MTTEERRWANGLRQAAPISNANVSVETSTMQRNVAVKRPSTVVRRSEPPFEATVALQAYLSIDTDARSRIPRPRPTQRTVGKEKVTSTVALGGRRSSSNLQQPETTLKENARESQLRTSVDTVLVAASTPTRDVASRAESPLSRFQKHLRQKHEVSTQKNHQYTFTNTPRKIRSPHYHSSRERGIPIRISAGPGTVQTLTRSLMDKIQEAKRLRQSEPVKGLQQKYSTQSRTQNHASKEPTDCQFQEKYRASSTDTASLRVSTKALPSPNSTGTTRPQKLSIESKHSPPIPHSKPVMPRIGDNFTEVDNEEKASQQRTKDSTPANMAHNIDDVITAIRAVRTIQRAWRLKQPIISSQRNDGTLEQTQVTLIIDKSSENERVVPLFTTDRMKCQKTIEMELQASQDSKPASNSSTLNGEKAGDVELQCTGDTTPPYDPWMDHELVFLEEGRCIGELHESVHKGVLMDTDELLWKRPHHIIQQLEAQRVSMIQKSRRRHRQAERDFTSIAGVVTPESVTSAEVMPSLDQGSLSGSHEQKIFGASQQKRKILRVTSLKGRNTRRQTTVCISKGSISSKSRKLLRAKELYPGDAKVVAINEKETQPESIHEEPDGDITETLPNQSKTSSQLGSSETNCIDEVDKPSDSILDQNKSAPETTTVLDRFVMFSDSSNTESDIKLLRNDLISVGDLALARSLLYEKRHCQPEVTLAEKHEGFIPLTVLSTLNRGNQVHWNEPTSTMVEPSTVTVKPDADEPQRIGTAESLEALEYIEAQWARLQEGTRVEENQCAHSDDSPSRCSSSSRGDNSPATSLSEEELPEMATHDPMRALKSAVTETVGRIHSKYRVKCSNQQLEPSPGRPRLDEAKRVEFLRVLDDFKRCLRQSSASCSQVDGPRKATP